jgi:xanthine/uracil/vitamin C permease (AzgA family)
MTLAEALQAVLLALAGNVPLWRAPAIALLALFVVGLVGLARAWWEQL